MKSRTLLAAATAAVFCASLSAFADQPIAIDHLLKKPEAPVVADKDSPAAGSIKPATGSVGFTVGN